jgi:hypothetical protein
MLASPVIQRAIEFGGCSLDGLPDSTSGPSPVRGATLAPH